MNRKELIDVLADKTGSSKIDTDRALSALLKYASVLRVLGAIPRRGKN